MKNFFKQNLIEDQLELIFKYNKAHWIKKIILSVMGGVFVALAYVGYFIIKGQTIDPGLATFLGAMVFPIGIIMCLFLGGYLFSSNALLLLSVFKKKIKWYIYLLDMLLIFVCNAIGCMIIAAIAFGAGVFSNQNVIDTVLSTAEHKIDAEWWNVFLSGILCNTLVAGASFVFYKMGSRGLAIFIVYVMIFLFVVGGYNHIVANFFVITEAGILTCDAGNSWSSEMIGKIFYNNLIPTALGNLFGGGLISVIYYIVEGNFGKPKKEENNITTENK